MIWTVEHKSEYYWTERVWIPGWTVNRESRWHVWVL